MQDIHLGEAKDLLHITRLSLRSFRNLISVDLLPGPRLNVLYGQNGQGKTNFLEALYVLATSKSFRTERPGDLVTHGEEIASVRGEIRSGKEHWEQSVGLKEGSRSVRVQGKRPANLVAYAFATPIVLFQPGLLSLTMGSSIERRKLLDRLSFFLEPSLSHDREQYRKASQERQHLLETRGVTARDLEYWEELMVRHALRVMKGRRVLSRSLADSTKRIFSSMGPQGASLEIEYAPNSPEEQGSYLHALFSRRTTDAKYRTATLGPHRDDLRCTLNGYPMRGIASQGQHRTVVLALKLSEIELLGNSQRKQPILLLDDVSSELDAERLMSFFSFLQTHVGQVFLTTTRPELLPLLPLGDPSERCDIRLHNGYVFPSSKVPSLFS